MKTVLKTIFQFILLIIWINSYSTKYQTASAGNWSSSSTWGGTVPSFKWSAPIDTIIIDHAITYDASVQAVYAHIIVNASASLTGASYNLEIGNSASMVNYGSISINALSNGWGTYSVTNYGAITLGSSLVINSGSFTTSGNLSSASYVTNGGTFNNSGTFSSSSFTNNSQFINSGTLASSTYFTNNYSSTGNNSGILNVGTDFTNNNVFTNSGTLNVSGGFLNNYSSSFTNDASSTIDITGNFTNNNSFSNVGNIAVDGTALNNYGSTLSNSGSMDIVGNLTNNNILNSSSSLIVGGSILNNYSSTITNTGEMEVGGDVSNYNTISNSGDLLVSGTVTNDGSSAITGEGTLCNPDGSTDPTEGNNSNVSNEICGGDASNLPVLLLDFTGVCYQQTYLLNWKTASEINNDFFTIFVSYDGKLFNEIIRIDGKGTVSTLSSYSAQFENSDNSVVYFRLMQTDYDGRYKVLKTIPVHSNSHSNVVNIYPNPVYQYENLYMTLPEGNSEKVVIISDIVANKIFETRTYTNNILMNTSEFRPGLYVVNIIIDGIQYSYKLQIL